MAFSKSKFSFKKEFKVSKESALKSVIDMCQRYDIDVDAIEDKQIRRNSERTLEAITEYTSLGYLEFGENGYIIQHLQRPYADVTELKYAPVNGQKKRVMDAFEENEAYGKIYAVLGAACGRDENAIEQLIGIDLKVAESIGMLFLV